jgi:hypothetical protein
MQRNTSNVGFSTLILYLIMFLFTNVINFFVASSITALLYSGGVLSNTNDISYTIQALVFLPYFFYSSYVVWNTASKTGLFATISIIKLFILIAWVCMSYYFYCLIKNEMITTKYLIALSSEKFPAQEMSAAENQQVTQFVRPLIAETYSYNTNNFDTRLATIRPYYTSEAWEQLQFSIFDKVKKRVSEKQAPGQDSITTTVESIQSQKKIIFQQQPAWITEAYVSFARNQQPAAKVKLRILVIPAKDTQFKIAYLIFQ